MELITSHWLLFYGNDENPLGGYTTTIKNNIQARIQE